MNARTHAANLITPSEAEVDTVIERAVESKIRSIDDEYLCREILCEFDSRSPEQFLPFLKAVREQDRFEIGAQLLAYLEMHFESQFDRSDIAQGIAEDAHADAMDAQRDARAA